MKEKEMKGKRGTEHSLLPLQSTENGRVKSVYLRRQVCRKREGDTEWGNLIRYYTIGQNRDPGNKLNHLQLTTKGPRTYARKVIVSQHVVLGHLDIPVQYTNMTLSFTLYKNKLKIDQKTQEPKTRRIKQGEDIRQAMVFQKGSKPRRQMSKLINKIV